MIDDINKLNIESHAAKVAKIRAKNSYRELTLIAIPNEGYKVKEWIFNGESVVENDSLIFTAKVDSKLNYNGVIVVKFEKIIENN